MSMQMSDRTASLFMQVIDILSNKRYVLARGLAMILPLR
jgi:hypothetical protein